MGVKWPISQMAKWPNGKWPFANGKWAKGNGQAYKR